MERDENNGRLDELIKGIRIAMLTTRDERGGLRSRPMATQRGRFDGDLWFFTREHAGKSDEIFHDQCVNLSYANLDDEAFVSVSGRAQIVKDRDKMKALWSPHYLAWFPAGLADPDLALLRVHVERAELWDSPPNAAEPILGTAKAAWTGTPALQDDARYHAKLGFDASETRTP